MFFGFSNLIAQEYKYVKMDTLLKEKISIRAIIVDSDNLWYAGDNGQVGFINIRTTLNINKQIEKSMEDTKKYFKDMSLYDFSTEINKIKSSNSITDPKIKQLIDSISNMTTQYASGYAPSFAKDQKILHGNNFLRIHGNNLDYLYYKIAQLNLFKKIIPDQKTSLESGAPAS
jgi:hypothetical protein